MVCTTGTYPELTEAVSTVSLDLPTTKKIKTSVQRCLQTFMEYR